MELRAVAEPEQRTVLFSDSPEGSVAVQTPPPRRESDTQHLLASAPAPREPSVVTPRPPVKTPKKPTVFKVGEVFKERYMFRELLGQGGMGEVWRVYDMRFESEVALKVTMVPDTQSSGVSAKMHERFRQEARIQHNLIHRHIVRVHDIDHFQRADKSLAYMTMDLGGIEMHHYLQQHNLAPHQFVALVLQLLDALHYCHASKVAHRDVKFANALVQDSDEGPVLKLMDFGIGKWYQEVGATEHPDATQQGEILGTLGYMPPEEIRGDVGQSDGMSFEDGVRRDLWSTAEILFRRFTGRKEANVIPAFGDLDAFEKKPRSSPNFYAFELLKRDAEDNGPAQEKIQPPVDFLARFTQDLPKGLAQVLRKALNRKDPRARFRSALEFKQALLPYAREDAWQDNMEDHLTTTARYNDLTTFTRLSDDKPSTVQLVARMSPYILILLGLGFLGGAGFSWLLVQHFARDHEDHSEGTPVAQTQSAPIEPPPNENAAAEPLPAPAAQLEQIKTAPAASKEAVPAAVKEAPKAKVQEVADDIETLGLDINAVLAMGSEAHGNAGFRKQLKRDFPQYFNDSDTFKKLVSKEAAYFTLIGPDLRNNFDYVAGLYNAPEMADLDRYYAQVFKGDVAFWSKFLERYPDYPRYLLDHDVKEALGIQE